MIRSLDADVRSLLRSGIAVSNLTQCLDELVVNSLDAEATCISVRVDIPSFRLRVIDNGCGISRDDLELLGERYATSKCHSLEDLNKLKSYGFRGEALASIRDISGVLEVVTRHKSSYKTYCKIFRNGKALKVAESCLPRSNVGTTVTAYEVFSPLPVRRKLVSDVLDFERIRQRLASIALINPNVSFSLYNEASGQKSLQTHKGQSVVSTFSQLFGNSKAKSLREICVDDDGVFKMSGYIGLDTYHNKNLQFLYVNGRLLLKTKIHKLVNQILRRSLLLKPRAMPVYDEGDVKLGQLRSSPKQSSDKYPIFIIDICCPLMDYDITLEPAKTLVEFQDWDGVLSCVQSCVESFLAKENLALPAEQAEDVDDNDNGSQAEDSSDNQVDLSVYEYQMTAADNTRFSHCISPSNIKNSLQSSVVQRKTSHVPGLGDRSVHTSSMLEMEGEMELTVSAEKRSKITNNSLNSDEVLTNLCPQSCVDITKDPEKNGEQVDKCCSESGLQKSSFGVTTGQNLLRFSRPEVLFQGPGVTAARTNSRSCFNSPNPITLQSTRSRKRLHIAGSTKGIDHNTSSNSIRFLLHRSQRVTKKGGASNATVFGNSSTSSNKSLSQIPTSGILGDCETSLRDSKKRISAAEQGSVQADTESSGERCCSEGDGQCQGPRERPLDLIELLDDKDSSFDNEQDTSKMGKTETQTSSLFSQDMVSHKRVTKGKDTNAPETRNKDSVGENRTSFGNTTESSPFSEMLAASPGREREDGNSAAATDIIGIEDGIRQDSDPCDRRETLSGLGLEHEDKSDVPSQGPGREDNSGPLENWQCTYDNNLQRKLYINLRTGNTTYGCPEGFISDSQDKEERNQDRQRETRTRGPLACAPHVSFDCTPWRPRKDRVRTNRTTQKECENNGSVSSSSQSIFDEKIMTEMPQGGSEGLVSLMFDEWDNPVLEAVPGMNITSLSKPSKATGNEVRAHRAVHPYRFTKDMVKNLEVIRQVDDKFIVCRVRHPTEDENGDDKDKSDEDYLIVLLDQHAVHERIRLEKLINDLYASDSSHTNQSRLKASLVSPPIELEFTSQELLLLKRFRSELQRVGVHFVIGSDVESSESRVIVHELPSPFVDREVSETRRRRPSVAVSIVKELIQSHVEHMKQTNGVAPSIPKTILRVLSSQACHGAVKFGERLSVEDCRQLIHDLSKCDLPFQCAHGRPSIVPLVDLQLLKRKGVQLEAAGERPKLRKLANAMCF